MIGAIAIASNYVVGASWFDGASNLINRTGDTGKAAAVAASIVLVLLSLVFKRTLGAVLSSCVLCGVTLWAVNNTSNLQDKTTTDVGMGRPATVLVVNAPVPAGLSAAA